VALDSALIAVDSRSEGEDEDKVVRILGGPDMFGPGRRTRRLKHMVYVKEMRAAITDGEFALQLRGLEQPGLIDYQRLCNRLYSFSEKLERRLIVHEVLSPTESAEILETLKSVRTRLEDRVLEVSSGRRLQSAGGASSSSASPSGGALELPDPRRLLLYVREDRTVDLDGALSEAEKAASFSRDLWQRLNGGNEKEAGSTEESQQEKPESRRVAEKRDLRDEAKRLLAGAEQDRRELLARVARDLGQELIEPEMAGSQLRPEQLRSELRDCDQVLRERKSRLLLTSIDWLLERVAEELEADLEKTSMADWSVSGRQLKLYVSEFSLLDKQASSYWQFLPEDPEACDVAECVDFSGLLDPEELSVLEGDTAEYVTRVGLEVQREEGSEDNGIASSLKGWADQLQRKTEQAQAGLDFYVTGGQLLGQDIQYAWTLISRAAVSSYTLKPQEVRTLQRTFKDLAVLIPFLIILIIPLTPVGHVLIFSFIQKSFPEFFPSTFTERRQNVVKIYKDILPEAVPDSTSSERA